MELEEQSHLEIPDEDAEILTTVGESQTYLGAFSREQSVVVKSNTPNDFMALIHIGCCNQSFLANNICSITASAFFAISSKSIS